MQQLHKELDFLIHFNAQVIEWHGQFRYLIDAPGQSRCRDGHPLMQEFDSFSRPSWLVNQDFVQRGSQETDAQHLIIHQGRPCGAVAVDTEQEAVEIETEKQLLERPTGGLGHRTTFILAGVAAGADPFEEGISAVDLHFQEGARRRIVSPLGAALDGSLQVRRRRITQQQVDITQVLAKQIIEQRVLGAGVIIAIPPEPVAALGDVKLLPSAAQCLV